MKDETAALIAGILIGVLFTSVITSVIVVAIYYSDIKELGQAICEEKYDMDFDDYYEKELRCKPKGEYYDGLIVKVVED